MDEAPKSWDANDIREYVARCDALREQNRRLLDEIAKLNALLNAAAARCGWLPREGVITFGSTFRTWLAVWLVTGRS